MKVFKFGGASVNSVERIQNLGTLLKQFSGEKILVIISAMGKTTNALEKVVEAFYKEEQAMALQLLDQVKQQHFNTAKYLLVTHYLSCEKQMNGFFIQAEKLLHERPVKRFDFYYDQVVAMGELLSTSIISAYLDEIKISNQWVDARDVLRTDNNFREAEIDWNITESKTQNIILPLFQKQDIVLTQGFIGASGKHENTTLGREGSDYTAAVFANILNAEQVCIWKDVEAVMNADPKQYPDAEPIPELNYAEVIEMAYYGAQVIHPKTIKPLQNKNIPLNVKCFLHPSLPGTMIHNHSLKKFPPIIVLKENQIMIKMKTHDFSFIGEHHLIELYRLLGKYKLKPNLTQNAAISLTIVLDQHPDKIQKLSLEASGIFEVQVTTHLTLLTIRHYQKDLFEKLIAGRDILLQQQTPETIQALMK